MKRTTEHLLFAIIAAALFGLLLAIVSTAHAGERIIEHDRFVVSLTDENTVIKETTEGHPYAQTTAVVWEPPGMPFSLDLAVLLQQCDAKEGTMLIIESGFIVGRVPYRFVDGPADGFSLVAEALCEMGTTLYKQKQAGLRGA